MIKINFKSGETRDFYLKQETHRQELKKILNDNINKISAIVIFNSGVHQCFSISEGFVDLSISINFIYSWKDNVKQEIGERLIIFMDGVLLEYLSYYIAKTKNVSSKLVLKKHKNMRFMP